MANLPKLDRHGPNCTRLFIGSSLWCISYQTVVAYKGPNAPQGVRRDRNYSRTTAKHMGAMFCKDWRQVSDYEFVDIASLEESAP